MMESICAGLGYSHDNSSKKEYDGGNVDSLMNHYMQSCLSYHEEQEMEMTTNELSFVRASCSSSISQNNEAPQQVQVATAITGTGTGTGTSTVTAESHDDVVRNQKKATVPTKYDDSWKERVIANARAIAERLSSRNTNSSSSTSSADISTTTQPQVYAQQRQSFRKQHDLKLQRALLKNFSYVMNRDKHDSKILMQHVQQVQQQAQQQESKQTKPRRSQDGIGTNQQKRLSRRSQINPPIGIYITGLPTNQGAPLESTLRSLFGAYGSLQKLVIYTDKKTGKVKGDGLVLYDPSLSSPNLVDTVFCQLNGAELPCGNVISVERADLNYKENEKNRNNHNSTKQVEAKNDVHHSKQCEQEQLHNDYQSTNNEGDDTSPQKEDDDLDDFFASLE